MLLWVTSKCNLQCPLCVVKYIQKLLPNYEMSMEEVNYFIKSSQKRDIHYFSVTLSGGEPTQWSHFEEAITLIYESGITDRIELVSNGTQPDKIFKISHMLFAYAISTTQCSDKNIEKFKLSGDNVIFNSMKHQPLPISPTPNSLPAECCSGVDLLGTESNQLNYINGKVYYCCNALLQSELVGLSDDLVCDFEDDFINKFSDKKYDKDICKYCLCNSRVWKAII
jgi:hypothetical protein